MKQKIFTKNTKLFKKKEKNLFVFCLCDLVKGRGERKNGKKFLLIIEFPLSSEKKLLR